MENTSNIYQFKIGQFSCAVIRDMFSPMDVREFFSGIPEDEFRRSIRRHNVDIDGILDISCLLIETDQKKILIDTGVGPGTLGFGEGGLPSSLEELGVSPSDIDKVVLTHAHPDHTGGNVAINGDAAFPNARYLICRDEYQYWERELNTTINPEGMQKEMLDAFSQTVQAVDSQLEMIGEETEIDPGIQTFGLPGHTPGQIGLMLTSDGKRLCVVSDVFHHEMEILYPHWHSIVDSDTSLSEKTRRLFLSRMAQEETPVLALHFPFPGVGAIQSENDNYSWHPAKKAGNHPV